MKYHNPQAGFTMLELVIVSAILAIMAAIAVPNYLTYIPKARLNGAARMVMVDLMAARMNAVKTNRSTQVHILDDVRAAEDLVDFVEGDACHSIHPRPLYGRSLLSRHCHYAA